MPGSTPGWGMEVSSNMADQIKCVFNVSDLMGDLRQVGVGQKIPLIKALRSHLGGAGIGPDGQPLVGLDLVQAKGLADEFSRILAPVGLTSTEAAQVSREAADLRDTLKALRQDKADLEADVRRMSQDLSVQYATLRSIRALIGPVMAMTDGHF